MVDEVHESQMEEARFWAVIEEWVGSTDYDWTEAANAVEKVKTEHSFIPRLRAAGAQVLSVIDADDPGDDYGRALDELRESISEVPTDAVGTPCQYAPRCVDERWQGHEDHVARRR